MKHDNDSYLFTWWKGAPIFFFKLPLGWLWKDEEWLGHKQNVATDTSTIDWLAVAADNTACHPLFKLSPRKRCILLLLLLECLKTGARPQQPLQGFILQKCRRSILERQKELSVCREFVNYFSFLRRTKMCGLEGREFYLLLSFFTCLKSFFNNRCKKEQFRLYSPCKRSYVSIFLIIVAQNSYGPYISMAI